MLKHKIFFKIYLWFWLATILVIASLMLFERLTQTGPFFGHLKHSVASTLALYGQAAAEDYGRGDTAALARLGENLHKLAGIDAYVLDETGRELSGRLLPEGMAGIVQGARQTGEMAFTSTPDNELVAINIHAPGGQRYVVAGRLLPGRHGPGEQSWLYHVIKTSIIFLVSGVVCYSLARYLTSPVLKLREATRRFAAGDLQVRIGPAIGRRRDELSELAMEFDAMADRIASLMTTQRQLLGDISHELRSPLARLKVALELARRQAGSGAEKPLNRIESEADLLNDLIGQVLTLTRLEQGMAMIPKTPVDLAELVREIAADAAFEAQGSGREVRLVECAPCTILAQEDVMRRAIENVVRNAITYTALGSEVDLSLRCAAIHGGSFAEIGVRDRGPGLAQEELSNIFQPFYRVSDARERQTGGSGLGLAITQRAIRLHHGTVWASNAQGGGLLVVILLPLGQAGPPAAQAA